MPTPYPQFVYDFTAARGIAKHLDTMTAKALVEHLEGEVSGNNDLATEIIKEIHSWHSYGLTQPGLPDASLDAEVGKLKRNAARGLVAALTRDKPGLSLKAKALMDALSQVHGIKAMDERETRDALLVCSVVYTLGRMTAAVSTVTEHVTAQWTELSPETQHELSTLISEAIRAGRTGADIDRLAWIAVLDHAEAANTTAQPTF